MTRILVTDDLAELLRSLDRPLEEAARELMVLELYRRGTISSGKAADLLGLDRFGFVSHLSQLGIPFFDEVDPLPCEQENLSEVIGTWKTDQPSGDGEIERILDEERLRKYG